MNERKNEGIRFPRPSKLGSVLIGGADYEEVQETLASVMDAFVHTFSPEEYDVTVISGDNVWCWERFFADCGGNGRVIDISGAEACLKNAVSEMDSRFSELRRLMEPNAEKAGMPYKIIVIDFIHLLYPLEGTEIEKNIATVSMKGRAANTFCFIAAPCPGSVVLSSSIMANIVTRIALRTVNKADSRYILGSGEAAELTQSGEVLVRLPYESGLRYYKKGTEEWKKL